MALSSLKRYFRLEDERFVLCERDPISLSAIEKGIVFVWAPWSGSAVSSARALSKTLDSIPDLNGLVVYFLDTDNERSAEFIESVGDSPEGKGETYWVYKGIVQHQLKDYSQIARHRVEQYTLELLARPHGNRI